MTTEPDTNSTEYQAFIEECLKHCHCEIDQPCDGVMAGGPCDRQKEHRDTMDDAA